jgi:hypothetical protein
MAGVAGILFAVSVLGPSAMAGATLTPLHITKECSEFTGDVPSFCTVTGSDFAAIPVGSKIFYFGPVIADPNFLSSRVVIRAGQGNKARGYCSVIYLDPPTDTHGVCTFWKGTGALHGFHASVDYSIDSSGVLHWDGTYLLG